MAEAKTIKARFVGDPRNPSEPRPDVMDAFGTTFSGDKWTEVSGDMADKVRGNDHFEVQGEKKAAAPEETGESTAEFRARIAQVTDREDLERQLSEAKLPGQKGVLEARLRELPAA